MVAPFLYSAILYILKTKFDDEGKMVAIAGLVAHAVIGAARTVAAIFLFFLKQKQGGMDVGRVHLFIYRTGTQDMVYATPCTFIAVGSLDAVLSTGILGEVAQAVLGEASEQRAIGLIVEIARNQKMGLR